LNKTRYALRITDYALRVSFVYMFAPIFCQFSPSKNAHISIKMHMQYCIVKPMLQGLYGLFAQTIRTLKVRLPAYEDSLIDRVIHSGWIPAFAGMTLPPICHFRERGNPVWLSKVTRLIIERSYAGISQSTNPEVRRDSQSTNFYITLEKGTA